MKFFTKLWLRYIYIKTYFILLKQGDCNAPYNASVHTENICCALFRKKFFSFLHGAEDKQEG